jgi:hypothetical protein
MDREDAWTFAELKDMKVLSTDKGEIKTVKISNEIIDQTVLNLHQFRG